MRVDLGCAADAIVVRLLERGADGVERSTPWSPVSFGATLVLRSEVVSDRRVPVLGGAQLPLALHW